MINRIRTQPWYPAVLLGLLLSLLGISVALGAGSIDPANKWAWSPTAGWINFDPDYGGVAVYPDHLEGYAWGENIGWIRLGTRTSGGVHTYANSSATTYGVNRAADGYLSGYAWSPGIGWINFDPAGAERVRIDPVTGQFSGYAWAENIGWIGMRGTGGTPRHHVDLTRYDISGVIVSGSAGPLAGASVSASGVATATTDASGAYTLTGLLAGSTYTVTPFLSGHGFNPTLTVIQLITQSVSGADFDWFATYTISGRVVDESSAPMAGVSVSDGTRSTLTDAAGYYTLTVPAGVAYTITPSLTDYNFVPPTINVPAISSNVSDQNFVASMKAYSISGQVLNDSGGVADVLLQATLLADGRVYTATTDATGAYRIENTPLGEYMVAPFLPGTLFDQAQRPATLVDQDITGLDFQQAGLPNIPTTRYAPGDIYRIGENGYSGNFQPSLTKVVAVSFNGFRAGVSWMNNPFYNSLEVKVPIVSPPTLLEGPVVLHTSDGNAIPLTGTFLVKTDFAETWAVSFYSTWLDDGKFLVVDGANVGEAATVTFDGSNIPNFRKLGNNRLLVPISDFTFYGQALVLTKASGSTITYSVSSAPPILINEIAPGQPGHFDMIVPISGDLGSVATMDRGTYAGTGGGILPNGQFASNAELYWDDGATIASFSWGYVQTPPALVGPRTIAAGGAIGTNYDISWSGTATIEQYGHEYIVTRQFTDTGSAGSLAALKLRSYLDQATFSEADDGIGLRGAPGQDNFQVMVADGVHRIGLGEQAIVQPAAGQLVDFTYEGFAVGGISPNYSSDLSGRILARTQFYGPDPLPGGNYNANNVYVIEAPERTVGGSWLSGRLYGGGEQYGVSNPLLNPSDPSSTTAVASSMAFAAAPGATTATMTYKIVQMPVNIDSGSDASLMKLDVAANGAPVILAPAFVSTTYAYTGAVTAATAIFTPTLSDPNAQLGIVAVQHPSGAVAPCSRGAYYTCPVKFGDNAVTIEVTSEDYSSQATYVVTLTRPAPATLSVTLAVTPTVGGTTSGGGDVPFGAETTITATPSVGYDFVKWSTDGVTVTTDAVYTFTPEDNTHLVADFAVKVYTLTVPSANGEIRTVPSGLLTRNGSIYQGRLSHGTVLTLTAIPYTIDYALAGWSEPCSGTGACVVTMTASSTVTATYALKTFALTIATAGTGTGTVSVHPSRPAIPDFNAIGSGTTIYLTYTVGADSVFGFWASLPSNTYCTGSGFPNAGTYKGTCAFQLRSDTIVTATFTSTVPTYEISGLVTTAGGAPIAGVTMSKGTRSATTDASGAYTIIGVANGTYVVTPTLSGYTFTPASVSVTVNSANVSDQNFTGTASTYSISGQVTTSGGPPLAGVTVSDGTRSATTDASGNYTITAVPNGTYTVTPTLSGYTFTPASASVTVSGANVSGQNFTGAAAPGTHSISGQVTTSGGAPIAGVTVSDGSRSATTDAAGNYAITGVPNGTYTVTPSLSGYTFTPASASVTVSGANVSGQNFTGAATPGTYTISGQVTTSGGAPIAGVTVSDGTRTATTDASGNYAITGVPNGTYTLMPSLSGYTFTPASASVTVSGANVGGQNFTGAATPGTHSISGQVTTSGGAPIAGVTVSDGTRTTTTNASGNYAITGVPNGTYTVTPSLSGYTFTPASASVTVSGANVSGQNFTGAATPGTYSISGQVTTSGGAPIAGVTVSDGSRSATTDAAGNYTITGVPNGTYTVTPSLSSYTFTPASASVTVSGANVSGQNFTGLPVTYSISGQVLDGSGAPLAGVTVSDGARSATTDASGNYMITGVPNGTYTLMPSLNGYIFTPFSVSVTVNNADVSGQNFTGVPVTYSISGQVLDGSGAPLAGVIISDGVRSAMSNVDGNYTIVGVPSGSYVVTPDKLGYRFEPSKRAVTIVDASATGQGFIAVAVPLPPGVITGMLYSDANYNGLYDAGEQGIVSGTLTLLHSSSAVLATVLTDETGHYTFSDAAVGAYTVQMTPPAGWVARGAVARTVSVISAATITVDFGVQAQGSISGALFEDSNSNGVQDNGEPGTAGVVVNLLLDGTLVQTTTTDADGLYGFIGVNPGRYLVQIEAPDGYIAGVDSEQTVMLLVGGSAGASFGLQAQGSISGVIFHDRNGNQSVDPGESGIAGARVRLASPAGGPLESTTDASGRYSFTSVATGTYHVQITPPSGWTVQGAPSRVVNLDSGAAAVSSFACQPAGAIVGAVFQDIDGDGVQAYNEPGMAGVAVYVARDGLFVANRLTDNQGVYHVDGLSAGDYLVMIAIPEGFAPVVTPSEQVARLADGLATTIGFGLQPIGVIAGVVYDDLNGDGARQASESGLAGASVSLYTAGPDGVFRTVDDVLVATASSDVEGLYRFANQPVNAYALRLLTPAGYNPTTSTEVMVNLAQFSSVVANFGNQAMGTVVAMIFEDLNDNGVQDAGENPLAGAPVSVEATAPAANLTAQYVAMTNIAGFAMFRNLPTGSYVVRTQAPDARYVGRITQANITVSPDEAVNRQFGFRQIGTVAGGIFTDLDGNSRQDSDEPGLGGVNVSLLDPDGALVDTTITDGEGGYGFDELPGGDFQIQITPPDGYLLTSPNPVPFVLADEGPDAAETVSVGVVSAANVYGRVFADMNKNGVRDVGENGIGGVAVTLHDPYAQQRSVRTTSSGLFLVTAVLYGASDVAIALPPYHEAITPDRVSLVVDGVHAAVARFALYPRQPNQAPVMEAIPDQVYDAGGTVSIQVVATDADDSWLTYDATGLPQGVTIDADSGLIAGQIAHAEHGEYLVTATVSDPLKASDQQSFLITVNRTEEAVFLYLPIIMNQQKLIFMPIILNHQQILFMPLLLD